MRNKIKAKNEYLIFSSIVMCIIGSFYIKYIAFIGMAIALIYIIKNDNFKCFNLLFFLLPLASVFKLSINQTSLFTILEFVFILKYFITNKKVKKKYFYYILFFLAYIFLSSVIAKNIDYLKTIKIFINLYLLVIFIDNYKKDHLCSITKVTSLGMIISSIIGLFKESIPGLTIMFSDMNTQYINGARVVRFSGTFPDPNYYSIAIIVTLGLILSYSISEKVKLEYIIFGIVLAIFGFFTYSKSFIIMILALCLIIIILLILNKKIGMFSVVIATIIFLLSTGIINNLPVVQSILSRFESNDANSLTTGRIDIWSNYIKYINSSLRVFFIGDGIGAPYIEGATHNMYIETWYYVGIIGIILYTIVIRAIFAYRVIYKGKIINYFLLIMVLIMYIFLAGFTAYEFPFYMMACWVVLNTKLNSNNKLKEQGEKSETDYII